MDPMDPVDDPPAPPLPSPPASPLASSPIACRLCRTPLPDPAARCPACGMHPARNLTPATKWRIAVGLLAVYAFVAAVLALTR